MVRNDYEQAYKTYYGKWSTLWIYILRRTATKYQIYQINNWVYIKYVHINKKFFFWKLKATNLIFASVLFFWLQQRPSKCSIKIAIIMPLSTIVWTVWLIKMALTNASAPSSPMQLPETNMIWGEICDFSGFDISPLISGKFSMREICKKINVQKYCVKNWLHNLTCSGERVSLPKGERCFEGKINLKQKRNAETYKNSAKQR